MDIAKLLAAAPAMAADLPSSFVCKLDEKPDSIEIWILDQIGLGDGAVDVQAVTRQLKASPTKPITVYVDSPGGAYYHGLSLYNALRNHQGPTESLITGLAFSAASLVAIGCDRVKSYEYADYGIHRAATSCFGNSFQFRDALRWLDRIDETMVSAYSLKTKKTAEEVISWLDGESQDGTLWSAIAASELGFIDEIVLAENVTNRKATPAAAKAMAKREPSNINRSRVQLARHRLRVTPSRLERRPQFFGG